MSREESIDPVIRFEAMLKNDTSIYFDVDELGSIIHYYIENHQIVLARKALSFAQEQYPNSLDIISFSVEIDIANDDPEKAKKGIEKLKKGRFDPVHLNILKAIVASKQSDHYIAIACYIKAIKLLQKEGDLEEVYDVRNSLAHEYTLVGEYLAALEIYEEALFKNPKDSYAFYEFIYCCKQTFSQYRVISVLNALTEKEPYHEEAWYELGKAFDKMGQLEKSIICYDYAILIDKKFVKPLLKKANIFFYQKDYVRALELYSEVLDIDPACSKAIFKFSKSCLKMGWVEQAMESYEIYLKKEKTDDLAYYNYAKICLKQSIHLESFSSIVKSISLYQTEKKYYKLLIKILDKLVSEGRLNHVVNGYFLKKQEQEIKPYQRIPFMFIVDYLIFKDCLSEVGQLMGNLKKHYPNEDWMNSRKRIIESSIFDRTGSFQLMKSFYLDSFVDLFVKHIKKFEV